MSKINKMLNEYSESHQNRTNQIVHKFCVPAIMFSLLGLLWAIPKPEVFDSLAGGYFNWATVLCIFSLIYYLVLSVKYFLFMVPTTMIMYIGLIYLDKMGIILSFSIITFILSWVLQIWGHKVEGKKPSFLKDIFFLLIGPLWVTKSLFNLKD